MGPPALSSSLSITQPSDYSDCWPLLLVLLDSCPQSVPLILGTDTQDAVVALVLTVANREVSMKRNRELPCTNPTGQTIGDQHILSTILT